MNAWSAELFEMLQRPESVCFSTQGRDGKKAEREKQHEYTCKWNNHDNQYHATKITMTISCYTITTIDGKKHNDQNLLALNKHREPLHHICWTENQKWSFKS